MVFLIIIQLLIMSNSYHNYELHQSAFINLMFNELNHPPSHELNSYITTN